MVGSTCAGGIACQQAYCSSRRKHSSLCSNAGQCPHLKTRQQAAALAQMLQLHVSIETLDVTSSNHADTARHTVLGRQGPPKTLDVANDAAVHQAGCKGTGSMCCIAHPKDRQELPGSLALLHHTSPVQQHIVLHPAPQLAGIAGRRPAAHGHNWGPHLPVGHCCLACMTLAGVVIRPLRPGSQACPLHPCLRLQSAPASQRVRQLPALTLKCFRGSRAPRLVFEH